MARSISDCTTLVNDTPNSQSSVSRPIERRALSANNPSNIRPSFSTPSYGLLNLQNAAEDQYARDETTSASMSRFLSEKDHTSNPFTTMNQRNIRGRGMQNPNANEHPQAEMFLTPASPIGLNPGSPLIRHLDNGTWQVGLRSPDVPGRDVR